MTKAERLAEWDKFFDEEFWPNYPRKENKRLARRSFAKICPRKDEWCADARKVVLYSLNAYLLQIKTFQTTEQYIKHPSSWINANYEKWEWLKA